LTSPNGTETWIVGESRNITWTRTGSFSFVKLEYSKNAFADETQTVLIAGSAPAAPLSYAWTIPDAIGTALKVRASDAADATVVDTLNADFTIKGSLTLTAPNGAEIWRAGESRAVTWTKTGSVWTYVHDFGDDFAIGGTLLNKDSFIVQKDLGKECPPTQTCADEDEYFTKTELKVYDGGWTTQETTKDSPMAFPDSWSSEEWLGIVSQGAGLQSPFLRVPRKAYYLYRDELWKD